MKRTAVVTALIIFALGAANPAATAQGLRVEGADVTAEPTSYAGPCPGVIKFRGRIQAAGQGRVSYTWLRSDGRTGPVESVDFAGPGVREVETTWTLGDASALPHYEGWQALKVLAPHELESGRAKFVLDCRRAAGGHPPQTPQQPRPDSDRAGIWPADISSHVDGASVYQKVLPALSERKRALLDAELAGSALSPRS